MKKIIAVILSIVLILSAASVGIYAAEKKADLSFAVASDLHYNPPREELENTITYEPLYWYANRRCAMEDESGYIIDEFLKQCAENDDCQFILVPGDMADDGRTRPEDHRAVAEKFRKFEAETGKQIYVINGNHDASIESNTTYDLFKEIYAEFGYDKALSTREDDCSYTADLSEKYRLIALDSNHPTASTEDGMSKEKINWVHEQVKQCEADGKYPILMMHHNLLDHLPIQRVISRNFIIRNHFLTAERFADWGIKVVLTGHEHCGDATSYTSLLGNKIYDFATTSLTMFPLAYRFFTFTDDEITYEDKTIDTIDYDALTANTKGYTDEMINGMKEDLYTYSKNFLKAGIKFRLGRDLNVEAMDISEDAFYYDIVATAVGDLTEMLDMPLYGEDGLQEIAGGYSIDIPDTEIKTGWDLVGELMAWHYAGEEPFDMTSTPEVTLLLRAAASIVRKDLADVSDVSIFKAANELLKKSGMDTIGNQLTLFCIDTFGSYTALEYLLAAIASPIAYTFAYDDDGVPDCNGKIEGYGVSGGIKNIGENASAITNKVLIFVKLIVKYLMGIVNKCLNFAGKYI